MADKVKIDLKVDSIETRKNLFIAQLQSRGYLFDSSNEYYEVDGEIGVKVGGFTHSCHVDCSDIHVVLFMGDKDEIVLKEVWDIWAKKV